MFKVQQLAGKVVFWKGLSTDPISLNSLVRVQKLIMIVRNIALVHVL